MAKFKAFDDGFQAETHCVHSVGHGVTEHWGDTEFYLIDTKGQSHTTTLRQALRQAPYTHKTSFL